MKKYKEKHAWNPTKNDRNPTIIARNPHSQQTLEFQGLDRDKLRHKIRDYVIDQGYQLPGNNLSMDKVVEYLKINIEYLEKTNRKEK